MFKHIIITRFNVKISDTFSKDHNGRPTLTTEWTNCRFDLFEKYCLPSVVAQTEKNFIWVVFFDSSTPDHYKLAIKRFQKKCPQFKPIFLDKWGNSKLTMKQLVSLVIDEETEYLITTRLDNDDALHKDFVKEVQRFYHSVHYANVVLNFIDGCLMNTRTSEIKQVKYASNHFISWLENAKEDFTTVIGPNHAKISELAPVIDLSLNNKPMWIEIIHENNVLNNFERHQPEPISDLFTITDFCIQP